MTSANVMNYIIYDKDGKEVGTHRQNLLCKTDKEPLLKFVPASDFTIQAWGYDEEEDDIWESEPQNLELFISKLK